MPLPWWTSQSRIATRSPRSARAAAHTATLLNRQKPMGSVWVAWWPGGRTTQKAASASPRSRRSTASRPEPAASRAASHEPGKAAVSSSIHPPPLATNRSRPRTSSGRWTRASSSKVAGRGSAHTTVARHRRRTHAGQHRVEPLRPLGMPAPRPVFHARRRALHQHGHRRRRLPPASAAGRVCTWDTPTQMHSRRAPGECAVTWDIPTNCTVGGPLTTAEGQPAGAGDGRTRVGAGPARAGSRR